MRDTKILIVEDEAIIAEDISASLARLGYWQTAVVDSGKKAIEMSARMRPGLVLMDIKLKGAMDGIEAAQEIRRQLRVPIVYLSDYADPKTLERARMTEPFGYLVKPYNELELRSTIEIALFKHQTELRLRESERWHTSILRDIGDAVITTDASGRVTFLNTIAEKVTGFTRIEALGKAIEMVVEFLDEKTRKPVEMPFSAVLRLGQPVQLSGALLRRTKDGAVISIDDNAAPIRDEAGKISGVVMVFRDTTHREQIEENLRQAQKMETVGKLAGGIAHDFNNLLTAILGGCNLILRDCKDDVLRERMQEIEEAGKRAATLTSQLLTFSRKQVFQPEVFDLRSLAQEMRGLLLRLAGTDVELKIEVGADPAIINADRAQIGHVLVNLVVNARDAMPDGGLVTLKVENVRLTESRASSSVVVPPGSYVQLTVTDTGCGMDENTLAHIFEPFFTTKESGKGTGLGLAMVYGMAQQSRAVLGVESAPGKGSAFGIYFPREQRRPEPASPEVSSVDVVAPGGGETILLAEDESSVRKVISAILSGQGYSILEGSDGVEALRIAEQYDGPIHLLLTDLIMPHMSGTMLAEKVGSLRPDTRVLFISGHAAGTLEHDGNLNPGMEFLQKPFTPAALSEKVRSILRPFYGVKAKSAQK